MTVMTELKHDRFLFIMSGERKRDATRFPRKHENVSFFYKIRSIILTFSERNW
jgi:hypothetical protein